MKLCLVVDDSHVVRKVLCRILEEFHFKCEEAEDGLKAYEFCETKMPDVIFLDWNMPVMNGLECVEKIRALDGGDKPTIIFCTTENNMTLITKGIKAGADEYIMKPFDSKIIKTKLVQTKVIEKDMKTGFDT